MKRWLEPRLGSLVMLMALVPMLGYFGHWSMGLPRPGEEVETPAVHDHDGHDHGRSQALADGRDNSRSSREESSHDHGQHCHGESATCTDVPFSGGATVAWLAFSIEGIGLGGAGWKMSRVALLRPHGYSPAVEPRPPRHSST